MSDTLARKLREAAIGVSARSEEELTQNIRELVEQAVCDQPTAYAVAAKTRAIYDCSDRRQRIPQHSSSDTLDQLIDNITLMLCILKFPSYRVN